jgi:oxygen-independent coproporphyrinogen-3 oxidase
MTISPDVYARYAAMRVPRYTSYPTAPNFTPAVGSSEYRAWLGNLPADSTLSIYLHVPFCRAMCWYCGCHTSVSRRQQPISRYARSLAEEIAMVAADLPSRMGIGHLHWGGGTPTLLEPEDVAMLSGALGERFNVSDSAEIAVEIDPRTLTLSAARAFTGSGVNRASIGVQTFDPVVQWAINRVQSFETTAAAVAMLRDCGISAVNFDLIYGLPHQSVASCVNTAMQALTLRPERLSVFGYAHVPSFKPHQRKIDSAALPAAAERQEQEQAIAEAVTSAGYVRIGLDHFALPGDPLAVAARKGELHRNFQGYTVDSCQTLIGFGASAIGRLPDGYVQNTTRIPDYEQRIDSGELAVTRGCALTAEDRSRAAVIEQLMCDYRAKIGGLDVQLERLQADGLVRRSGSWVEVTDEARPLVRAVAAAFDAYLPDSTAVHAVAV